MRRTISAVLCAAILLTCSAFSVSAASSASTAGTVSTASTRLNVRSSAGGSIVTSLAKGSYVTLMSKSGNWWYVEYAAGAYGYCSADFITQLSGSYAAAVKTTSGRLNVRSGAGTNYSAITSLASGTNVVVLSQSGGWSRILFNGVSVGYVSSAYLSTASSSAPPTSGYSKISLSVPDYKQRDSRWANTKLGSTSYTIGSVGCTTCTLAMTESYRTGTTINPNTMASRLSYSSTASLYWPSNYVNTTDSSNYLNLIYNLLKQGKPVIVGSKKANGSQHWVVVKGCYSVKTLTPSAFIINDPGTSTRTSLGQFFGDFPYLYKIVWYN